MSDTDKTVEIAWTFDPEKICDLSSQGKNFITNHPVIVFRRGEMSLFYRCLAKLAHRFIVLNLDRFVNKYKEVFNELAKK